MFRTGGLNFRVSSSFPTEMEINKDGDHVFTEDDVVWTKEVMTFLWLFLCLNQI